uniref:Uncharacterized protein n=1 Tax=Arundo donax TaxID=35708 RepID=A0A0A9C088_ARUDO
MLVQVWSYVAVVEQDISVCLKPSFMVKSHNALSSQSSTNSSEERCSTTNFCLQPFTISNSPIKLSRGL